jgi:RNA-dependent RNA polymerase
VLFANSVDFGFMFDEKTMTRMYTAIPQAGIANLFELNLLRRHIHIQFPVNTVRDSGPKVAHDKSASPPKRAARYCFRIPLEQLQRVHEIQIDQVTKALLISLETPPNFFRKADDIQQTHDEGSVYWTEWDTWLRQTDIVDKPENLRSATVTLKKVRPIIDIGKLNLQIS